MNYDDLPIIFTCKSLAEWITKHSIKPMSNRYIQYLCSNNKIVCHKTGENTSNYVIPVDAGVAFFEKREQKLSLRV